MKMAFDVSKPSMESKIVFSQTISHRSPVSRIARRSFATRGAFARAGVEAPVLWGRLAKYVSWKAEEKWNARVWWGLDFGGKYDNEYVLRRMLWADNHWLFSDS